LDIIKFICFGGIIYVTVPTPISLSILIITASETILAHILKPADIY
jgi:hypothetical protein